MMISVKTAIYCVITLGFLIWFLSDLFSTEDGGYFFSGKTKGQLGCFGTVILAVWIIFTLIWGGIFWW